MVTSLCERQSSHRKNPKEVYKDDTAERLAEFKLWSLEDRRVRADLIEVFTAQRSYASAVLGVVILSVRPSVCLSVRHTRAL